MKGIGIDLDGARLEIDDPIGGDARAGITPELDAAIALQAAVGDFDDKRDVGRVGMCLGVIFNGPLDNRAVRFGFAIGKRYGFL